jgi:hypothetical protein
MTATIHDFQSKSDKELQTFWKELEFLRNLDNPIPPRDRSEAVKEAARKIPAPQSRNT